MRPIANANQTAVAGIHRQLERFEKAASGIAELTTGTEAVRSVDVTSGAQRALASADSTLAGGLEGKMVDIRVAKYLAIANMKVLETADEMLEELFTPGGPP
jgi:hypothetical protein